MIYSEMAVEDLLVELKGFQQAQGSDPNDPDPPFQCGQIYDRLGDRESAIRSYLRAVERDSRFLQAHFSLALAYSGLGKWAEAESAYRRVVWLEDGDHEAWANLGAVYEAQVRDQDALAAFKKAVALDPMERDARHRIGAIYFRRADWERARAAYEEAVAIDENDYDAWTGLGLVAYHQNRDDEAREYYLKAIQIDSRHARAWSNLGNTFARMGQEKAAEEAYRAALQHEKGDPNLWFNLGEFYFRRGRPETEDCLVKTVKLDRDDLEAWEMLRQWMQHRPNLPLWKDALDRLLAARPDDLSLLRELADVQYRLGDTESALGVLRQLIALDADDAESRLMLSRLYLGAGRPLDAYRHLGPLDSHDEEVIELWYRVGQRLIHRKHEAEAESCFLMVAAHRPLQTDPWQFLGELAFGRGELDLAYERFMRAIDLNRNDASAWLPLARSYVDAGGFARAVQCLENLEEHLAYLPDDWGLFWRIHERAGEGVAFLRKLEKLMEKGALANHLWLRVAELYADAGMENDSGRCFSKLEEGDVVGDAGQLALARYYLHTHDTARALRYLDRLEETQGNRPAYWQSRAEAYYRRGDLDAARAAYERALALDDSDYRAWFNLGNIAYRAGQVEDAHRAFRAATELAPREAKTWYNLGLVQDELGHDSLISLRRAVTADRRFAQAWNALGVQYFKGGDDPRARRCFLRCVAVSRQSVLGWYNLGTLYTRMERKAEAERCMARVEELGGLPSEESFGAVRLFYEHEPPSQEAGETQPAEGAPPAPEGGRGPAGAKG